MEEEPQWPPGTSGSRQSATRPPSSLRLADVRTLQLKD